MLISNWAAKTTTTHCRSIYERERSTLFLQFSRHLIALLVAAAATTTTPSVADTSSVGTRAPAHTHTHRRMCRQEQQRTMMGVRIFSRSLPNNRNNNVRRPSEAKRQQDQSIVAVFLSFFVFSFFSRIFFSFFTYSLILSSFFATVLRYCLVGEWKKNCLVSTINDNNGNVLTSSFLTFSFNGKTTTIVLLLTAILSSKTHRAHFLCFDHFH